MQHSPPLQMAGHEWEDWFEREEFIGQISDIRVQNLQVERELVQKRTFTRWMNLHLEKCDPPIEVHDLFRDIQDGHILMVLLEELSGCKLLHGFKKSSHRIFRLNNIAKVLSFLEERNVKLVSIDAADVADGNPSIILGLIWNIILFFQIKELTGNIRSQFPSSSSLSSIPTSSESDTSNCSVPSDERQLASTAMREHSKAIKKLLQWVQKQTRRYGVAVRDFGKSWTSGLAFLAVIKSIDPSLVDMRKALLRNAKENLEDSFRIAHYSLGIPRLLEPEDVTINAPDEQSIMTYVSQFLEHFPGIEEPEEHCKLIERSVSMGRLNYRDSDSNHIRNSAHKSRVKERSYMFQRACAQPPPKILISSVSEDSSAVSPRFRPTAARSWSSEDFLADSPHMDDVSSSMVEEATESASEVLSDLTSNSPQLSYTHSPMASSVSESVNTESVIGDSAISSPDSWVESEFGVMPEKFCESRSDSSLCDSGTAWDMYHATPVEVTSLDEGFILSKEDRTPDEQSITESYIDEGIYSLSSLESTQERIQGHSEKNQVEGVKEKGANLDKGDQQITPDPDHSKNVVTEEVDSKPVKDPSVGQYDGGEPSSSNVENLLETDKSYQSQLEQTSVEERTCKEPECLMKPADTIGVAHDHDRQVNGETKNQNDGNKSEEFKVETECQKKDPSSEDTRGDSVLKEIGQEVVETQDEASAERLEDPNADESFSSDILANTNPTNQERASKTSIDPSMGINIPLISISTEANDQDKEETCDEERQENKQAGVDQAEGTDTNVNSPQNPHELNSVTVDKTEDIKPTASKQMNKRESGHLEDHENRSSNAEICGADTGDKRAISEVKQECESPHHESQKGITEKDLDFQTSSMDAKSQPVNTEQGMDSVDQRDGHQIKLDDNFSEKKTDPTQKITINPVKSKPIGSTGTSNHKTDGVSRDIGLCYTDLDPNSPTEDVVGDPIEPMDLFYPDIEEPVFTELPDTEMQSWPSVLSVSALQPAPASETELDQPISLLSEDFGNGEDSMQENDKMIRNTNLDTDRPSESHAPCLMPGEKIEGLWSGDVSADGSDLRQAEQHSSGSSSENTETVRCKMREAAVLLTPCVLLCLLLSFGQAARQGQDIRCGACRALVDEMEWAISQIDPKKMIQTGSFRINPDGSQSIREVPLARSEGNLLELMEIVCERMADYGESTDSATSRKSYIRIKSRTGEPMDLSEATLDSRVTSSLKFACETIVEQHEDEVIEFFAHETENVKDRLCSKRTDLCDHALTMPHDEL